MAGLVSCQCLGWVPKKILIVYLSTLASVGHCALRLWLGWGIEQRPRGPQCIFVSAMY